MLNFKLVSRNPFFLQEKMNKVFLFTGKKFLLQKSENSNFVPMDFSGSRGRVIKDPLEVAMVEMEHQTSWKRRLKHRISNASKLREMI